MSARLAILITTLAVVAAIPCTGGAQDVRAGSPLRVGAAKVDTEADCTAAPPATDTVPAHCRVDGVFAPVDTAPTARVINFRVILPASWNRQGRRLAAEASTASSRTSPVASSAPADRRCCSAASPPTAAIRATSCRRSAAAAGRHPRRLIT